MTAPDIDEYLCFGIMAETSVRSKGANGLDSLAIVGNVLGANDGVVVSVASLVEVVVV